MLERQKNEAEAAGIKWIPPEERLRLEEEQAEIEVEQIRIEELKARCIKKGLDFEKEETDYRRKLAVKQARKKVK